MVEASAPGSLAIALAGETVVLLPGRALWWPRMSLLAIADLHLGKGDHFRRAGIALPSGGTAHDLKQLGRLLDTTRAARLLVLGDLLHAAVTDAPWREAWIHWRRGRATLSVELVSGNHDRALHAQPALAQVLGIHVHGPALQFDPFVFVHDPADAASLPGYRLGGHVHPVVRLPGVPPLPAFRFDEVSGVLPAFTAFAGGWRVDPEAGARLFACAPDAVIAVSGG
ncbi:MULTISPECIES: ligase-associated DNA damage response endonuclease PdeM [Luteimonas]|uniref:Phosphoesterase n=1 Tax=Luteimonas chenhongjianii TaxID=2006110 RepID=A0A290XGN4_9GAMM|nr:MULTISPECIES: ligase-associated DNA damage response endonuclease PdeM [Luteimonas]ATD68322.1 phosphoesterase [Luteimonas chenhongjianii]RPD87995.1 ligase-associated DNA damage response endonuclease PdeM [Luteimonas sp. 100069]